MKLETANQLRKLTKETYVAVKMKADCHYIL